MLHGGWLCLRGIGMFVRAKIIGCTMGEMTKELTEIYGAQKTSARLPGILL